MGSTDTIDAAAAPWQSLSTAIADLDVEVNDIAGILNVHHARLVDTAIVMLDDDRIWSGAGMTSVASWLAWRTGVSPATAASIVTIAQRAADLPATLESFRRGELSLDQAASIARKAPWWCDQQARDYGRVMTVTQLRAVLGAYPYPHLDTDGHEIREPNPTDTVSDPTTTVDTTAGDATTGSEPTTTINDAAIDPKTTGDATSIDTATIDTTTTAAVDASTIGAVDGSTAGPESSTQSAAHGPAPSELPDEWCSIIIGDDGMYRLTALLQPDTGLTVNAALDAARDHLFNNNTGHTGVNAGVTTIDALRHMAERSLDNEPDPRRRTRFTTSLSIDITTGTMTDVRGYQLPDTIRQHITCDGTLTPTYLHNTRPVSVGRTHYVVPQRTRTIIEHRDHGHCRVPGCTTRHGLEIHHIIHWEHGGPTNTNNLILICSRHHRLHHHGRLTITGNADNNDDNADGLEFRNQHGRIITPSGATPNPPNGPPPRPPAPYHHPDGGRLDKRWIYFQPPRAHIEELLQRSASDTDYLQRITPPWMN